MISYDMGKPTFYTAFANCMINTLPNLSEEAMKISDLLQELAFKDQLYYIKDELFDIDRLVLNFSKYGDRFDIFYFSGHGKDGCLQLTGNFTMKPAKMSDVIMTSLKNVKLIFFNACETFSLAQEIVRRRTTRDQHKTVLIAARNEINMIIGELFATLFFKQIGQPDGYRGAYDRAKDLVSATNVNARFREFHTVEEVMAAGNDFDIGYIEINAGDHKNGGTTPPTPAPAPTSIIETDKLTQDALTTNYLKEVVQCIAGSSNIEKEKKDLLLSALEAARQIVAGKQISGEVSALFDKAAEQLPGLTSSVVFYALINTEKNIKAASVQKLIKMEGSVIDSLTKQLNGN